jgi:hypothetical protein
MDTAGADNAINTVTQWLKLLGAKVTPATVRRTLEHHPEFPALNSLSDALDRWRIDNAAFRLGMVEQLRELPLPLIVHQKQNGGRFRLITELEGDKLTYWDSEQGIGHQSLGSFEQIWSGVVLIAEVNTDSGETNYKSEHRKQWLKALWQPAAFTLFGLVLILTLVLLPNTTWVQSGWLLTKTVGLALSIVLLAKQFGSRNSLIDRLCRVGAKSSCQSLLDSPAAKLGGWLSWAEIGTLYFAGGLIVTLISPSPLLGWMAFSALPYTLFSVYYQARVARIWCPLCLGVQAIFVAEAAWSFTQPLLPITDIHVFTTLFAFALAALGWILLRPVLESAQQRSGDHQELMAFKRNPLLFDTLLREQEPMPVLPTHLRPLWLGQSDAAHTLTIVTNPYCGPCKQQHKDLEVLLSQSPAIKVGLIFFTSEVASDKVTRLAQHLLALDSTQVHDALTAWFTQPQFNYEVWAQKFPLPAHSDDAQSIAIEHGRWCWSVGVTATPTTFFDGYRLPVLYQLTDLAWLFSHQLNRSVS